MKKILTTLAMAILFTSGCEDIETFVLDDGVEIERYLVDDDLGKIFFSTKNLVLELPYSYPFDSTGMYVDLFDSLHRDVISYFTLKDKGSGYSDPYQEFGSPFGSSQDAEVEVRDLIYGHTLRIEGVDTTIVVSSFVRELNRFAYFMKLGDDGQRFSGWIMRGFSGGATNILIGSSSYTVYNYDGTFFPGFTDHYETLVIDAGSSKDTIRVTSRKGYILLTDDQSSSNFIPSVPLGGQIRIEGESFGDVFHTMAYVTASDTILENFTLLNNSKFEVVVQTPTVNNNKWDFIYLQEFVRDVGDTTAVPLFHTLGRKSWVIPFKVN